MSFTEAQYEILLKDPEFNALIQKYGKPKPGPKTCDQLQEGDICMETQCFNNKKLVMKCKDKTCTDYEEVDC